MRWAINVNKKKKNLYWILHIFLLPNVVQTIGRLYRIFRRHQTKSVKAVAQAAHGCNAVKNVLQVVSFILTNKTGKNWSGSFSMASSNWFVQVWDGGICLNKRCKCDVHEQQWQSKCHRLTTCLNKS